MGTDKNTEKAISTAREFVEKAAAGARGEALAGYFDILKPYLDISIKGVFSRWSGPPPISIKDISQALYEKFLTTPPQKTGAENPLSRIQAWANATAFRLLISERRKERVRALHSEEIRHQASNPSAECSISDIVEQRLENQRFVQYLELEGAHKLAEIARIVFETGSVDSEQLGARLEISPTSAYKRLQRLRLARAMYDTMRERGIKKDAG
ncbi:MAG: hypothetical protein ABIJ56_22640 [Pseudomonadota bacterium]